MGSKGVVDTAICLYGAQGVSAVCDAQGVLFDFEENAFDVWKSWALGQSQQTR